MFFVYVNNVVIKPPQLGNDYYALNMDKVKQCNTVHSLQLE